MSNHGIIGWDWFSNEPRPVSVATIQHAVAAHFQVPKRLMTSRAREAARVRQVAMYLAREMTPQSNTEIGRRFGRDHTTVLHGVRRIRELSETDAKMATDLDALRWALVG